jgi:iron uptake system component EfeO
MAGLLARGAHAYGNYVDQQVGLLVVGVQRLRRTIRSGHLRAARLAYANARPYYDRIEPVAQSFGQGRANLDSRIDSRAGDVPVRQWRGFHVLEKGLFATKSVAGLEPVAADLVRNVERLRSRTRRLTLQPAELLDAAGDLLDGVSKSEITGDNERYSHIDLVDMQASVQGAARAFASAQPGLARVDHSLARQILRRFTNIEALLAEYADPGMRGGHLPVRRLSARAKRRVWIVVRAAKEPLSHASSTLAAAR